MTINSCSLDFADLSNKDESLAKARYYVEQHDFQFSLVEAKKALELYPESMGDEALFLMALIYSHPENTDRDYQKSLEALRRLQSRFPDSPLMPEAMVLEDLIHRYISQKKKALMLEETLATTEKSRLECQEKVSELKKEIDTLQLQLSGIKKQMQKLKEIDLRIEKKR